MATPITRTRVQELIEAGAVVVEALPEAYYREAHLPGALNLPHDQVDQLAPTLLGDVDAEIVVYCANRECQNSTIAAQRLTQLGYTRVYDYEDGKADWIEAGLPVDSSTEEVAS